MDAGIFFYSKKNNEVNTISVLSLPILYANTLGQADRGINFLAKAKFVQDCRNIDDVIY